MDPCTYYTGLLKFRVVAGLRISKQICEIPQNSQKHTKHCEIHYKPQLLVSVAFLKLAILQENLSNLFGLLYMFAICLTTRFFLTEIIICSFNKSVLKKYANGKAFYIMATSQFFAALILEHLVVLGCCLLAAVMKFHDKFASLRQVNSPNS